MNSEEREEDRSEPTKPEEERLELVCIGGKADGVRLRLTHSELAQQREVASRNQPEAGHPIRNLMTTMATDFYILRKVGFGGRNFLFYGQVSLSPKKAFELLLAGYLRESRE